MNLAKTPDHIKVPRLEKKICKFPGCGQIFMGHFIAKYCDEHKGVRSYTRNKTCFETSPNRIINHGLNHSCWAVLNCEHPGCTTEIRVNFIPRVNTYPRFCAEHRPEHKRRTDMDQPKSMDDAFDMAFPPAGDNPDLTPAFVDSVFVGGRDQVVNARDQVVNAFDDDSGDDDIMITDLDGNVKGILPIDTDETQKSATTGETKSGDKAVRLDDLMSAEKPPMEFFDPTQVSQADDADSDDDAGMVRPGFTNHKTVLADGKEVEYAQAAGGGFDVELGGIVVAMTDARGRITKAKVSDFFSDIDMAKATISSNHLAVYYQRGTTKAEVVSGVAELSIDDIVRWTFVNDEWRRR